MDFGSFTVTYSLNVMTICVLWTGTPVVPGSGLILVMTGGMVSFLPPLGGVVVFAQEGEKNIEPNTRATGTAGISLTICFLKFISIQFCYDAGGTGAFYKSVRITLWMPFMPLSLSIISSSTSLS